MYQIINLTPHNVEVHTAEGGTVIFPKAEKPVRLGSQIETQFEVEGVPVVKEVFGDPENLPDYEEGKLYIVSSLVKSALPQRSDLLSPSGLVRDESGRVVGCKALSL